MRAEQLAAFRTSPLSVLGKLDKYCVDLSREDAGLAGVSGEIPFDVSGHDQARSEVARSMMARLREDVAHFAQQHNQGVHPRLPFLLADEIEAFVAEASSSSGLGGAVQRLIDLIQELERLREKDYLCLNATLPLIASMANEVPLPNKEELARGGGKLNPKHADAYGFYLRRYAGGECHLWFEYLFGALLSSAHEEDLRKLNPYLTPATIATLTDLIGSSLLHANRVGQTNRALLDARHLLQLLEGLLSGKASPPGKMEIHLKQGGEALARSLTAGRHYMDGEGFDPRFLVFEFCWNILLRKKQVEMVRDFVGAIREGKSMVKQMIMGAGKTTVVGPLLCLILGDGGNLVTQVVPPALLEFSRSVLRTTFSSIMQKRVYTLECDRASEVNGQICNKLQNAIDASGVLICTPTTVKSFLLKFLEALDVIRDEARQGRSPQNVQDALELARVLGMFREGVLIMDEVDLILHPLKSELNFPIGPKLVLDPKPDQSYLRWR